MAKTALLNVTLLYGGLDLSGSSNSLANPFEVAPVETINFASGGWSEPIGGIKSAAWSVTGFQEVAAEPDSTLFGNLGVPVYTTFTLSNPMAAGDISYTQQTLHSAYSLENAVGDAAKFSSTFTGTGTALRGKCLETVTAAASGASSGLNLGAVSATQKVYAILHVLGVTGTSPTLDLIVPSDGDDTWASPTTRLTFAQVTDDPSTWNQIQELSGAITDTWWRASRTIGGTSSPTFRYRLFLVIQ